MQAPTDNLYRVTGADDLLVHKIDRQLIAILDDDGRARRRPESHQHEMRARSISHKSAVREGVAQRLQGRIDDERRVSRLMGRIERSNQFPERIPGRERIQRHLIARLHGPQEHARRERGMRSVPDRVKHTSQ